MVEMSSALLRLAPRKPNSLSHSGSLADLSSLCETRDKRTGPLKRSASRLCENAVLNGIVDNLCSPKRRATFMMTSS
jgi:hypothetical protein